MEHYKIGRLVIRDDNYRIDEILESEQASKC